MKETKPRHVLTEMKRQICFRKESNLLLQAKYFGPGKIAYIFLIRIHVYVQVKNVFIQERASSIQKFRSLC